MAAVSHRRQHRLAILVDGKTVRLAHDKHRELICTAGNVCMQLDFPQEHRRDTPSVQVLAQTPWAGSAQIRHGGEVIFLAGQDGAQGVLGIEFGTGRGAGLVEIRINGLHPFNLVIRQLVVENW